MYILLNIDYIFQTVVSFDIRLPFSGPSFPRVQYINNLELPWIFVIIELIYTYQTFQAKVKKTDIVVHCLKTFHGDSVQTASVSVAVKVTLINCYSQVKPLPVVYNFKNTYCGNDVTIQNKTTDNKYKSLAGESLLRSYLSYFIDCFSSLQIQNAVVSLS